MGQEKHRLVGLKKIDTGVDTSGKQVQNTAGPGTDRSRSKSPEESIESIKQGARELTLSVSAICEKNGKKLAYVTCTDGVHWQLKERGTNFGLKRSGEITPFAAFSGSKSVSLLCSDAESAFARLDLVKHYNVARTVQEKQSKKGCKK